MAEQTLVALKDAAAAQGSAAALVHVAKSGVAPPLSSREYLCAVVTKVAVELTMNAEGALDSFSETSFDAGLLSGLASSQHALWRVKCCCETAHRLPR